MPDEDPKRDAGGKGPAVGAELQLPWEPLPAVDADTQAAIETAAAEINDRYIVEFLEAHAFCPYSRGGRAQGQTVRYVHYAATTNVAPLIDYLAQAAKNPKWMVVQLILPMIEVPPETWIQFGNELTVLANARLGTGSDVYAVAAMHPQLPYEPSNPAALIPLFRRSPDPTLQWVRLDDLEALYEGRSGQTRVVDLDDPASLLESEEEAPLFERITEANQGTAVALGYEKVEEQLAQLAQAATKRYREIIAGS